MPAVLAHDAHNLVNGEGVAHVAVAAKYALGAEKLVGGNGWRDP
jgi:hypothetical protein